MDFALIPPEVTSGQMYAGPGAESLLAAATAWDGLAAELQSAMTSYSTVLTTLTAESWLGPSAAAMTAAATPFVSWMSTAAAQAKESAVQAGTAAGAFEVALAAVVPPPVIAANRSLRAALLASNTFGQNTAAIAAADAQYFQMWAQDAAAMFQYQAATAAATQLTPFAPPPQATNPASQAGPGIAAAGDAADLGGALAPIYESLYSVLGVTMKFGGLANVVLSGPNFGMVQLKTFYKAPPRFPEVPKSGLGAGLGGAGMNALGAGLGGGPKSAAGGGMTRAVTAGVGTAPSVGGLSVPQGWATATPAIRLAATSLPTTGAAAAPMAGIGSVLNPAALGSLTGGALGAPGPRLINGADVRGGAGGKGGKGQAPVQLDKVLAQLQKQKDAVQHWQIDEAGLDDLLEELSKKPGFHAVHLKKAAKEAVDAAATVVAPKSTFG
ncbi:PPE family protein [[Mycobacterium] nativiensis]|uniref:PPE family protein n=1 Tax=[Mycobacterium] nativiensis TaxID=2855503 RepID=A0ABU5Y0V0_9MYCO|nr:PPE family protein [Mycolicibacter sp. MYC340]MEB3033657.1 PPE family protein [Mycolicibacter sp. MYC340]